GGKGYLEGDRFFSSFWCCFRTTRKRPATGRFYLKSCREVRPGASTEGMMFRSSSTKQVYQFSLKSLCNFRSLAALLCLVVLACPVWSQTGTSGLTGVVTDPQGKAVSGA